MKKRVIEKLKSPVVWASFIALAADLLIQLGLPELSEYFNTIATFVLAAVIMFGVLNDPNSKDQF